MSAGRLLIVDLVAPRTDYGQDMARGVGRYNRLHRRWRLRLRPLDPGGQYIPEPGVAGAIVQTRPGKPDVVGVGHQLPWVNVSTQHGNGAHAWVCTDGAAVGETAFEFFRQRGYREFAWVPPTWGPDIGQRGKQFCQLASQDGLRTHVFDPQWARQKAHQLWEAMKRWLTELPKPAAVFAHNDSIARQVTLACLDEEIRVPEDIAVLGVDNDTVESVVSVPPLASIALPVDRVGFEAARRLDGLLSGTPVEPAELRLPPLGIVLRQSADAYASADPHLVKALQFINAHAHEDISVEDVVRQTVVTRRWIEMQFRRHLGRTPAEEIRRVRIARARDLLAQTDLPMPEVARRCGFPSAGRLSQAFAKAMQMPPTAYRRRVRIDESAPDE